mgnify:CR=1 FL=1
MTGPASNQSVDPNRNNPSQALVTNSAKIEEKAKFSRKLSRRLGPYVVILAVMSAIFTLLVMSGFTPLEPEPANPMVVLPTQIGVVNIT